MKMKPNYSRIMEIAKTVTILTVNIWQVSKLLWQFAKPIYKLFIKLL